MKMSKEWRPLPKPPVGWAPWEKPSLYYRVKYCYLYSVYKVKNFIRIKFGPSTNMSDFIEKEK